MNLLKTIQRTQMNQASLTDQISKLIQSLIKIAFIKQKIEMHDEIIECSFLLKSRNNIIQKCNCVIDISRADHYMLYAISSHWWREWCDYVNIEFFNPIEIPFAINNFQNFYLKSIAISDDSDGPNESQNCIEKSNNSTQINSILNESVHNPIPSITIKNEFYKRPKIITNRDICEFSIKNNKMVLLPEMQKSYNYVVINSHGWKYLKSWYGCDFEVVVDIDQNSYITDSSIISF